MSAAKLKIRGKVTRAAIKHGKSVEEALKDAVNRYVSHAQNADRVFAGNFAEYLGYYVPQIEDYVMKEIQQSPDYFKKDDAGKNVRIQLAAKVAAKNSELAAEWRKAQRLKVINMKKNGASSLKQYSQSLKQGTTASTNIVRV